MYCTRGQGQIWTWFKLDRRWWNAPLMQDGEELEIESSPMWLEQSSWSAKNQVTNFSIYNNSIRKIGKYPVVAMAIGLPTPVLLHPLQNLYIIIRP